jgi:hypothetical protein
VFLVCLEVKRERPTCFTDSCWISFHHIRRDEGEGERKEKERASSVVLA